MCTTAHQYSMHFARLVTPLLTDARPARLSRIGTGPDLDLVEAVGRLLLLGGVSLDHPAHSLPKELVVQLQDDRVQHAANMGCTAGGLHQGLLWVGPGGGERAAPRAVALLLLGRRAASTGSSLGRPQRRRAGRGGSVRCVTNVPVLYLAPLCERY